MKTVLVYGMGLTFSLAIATAAFAGNDKTDGAKQTTACKDKKACKGKCSGNKKCCDKDAKKSN